MSKGAGGGGVSALMVIAAVCNAGDLRFITHSGIRINCFFLVHLFVEIQIMGISFVREVSWSTSGCLARILNLLEAWHLIYGRPTISMSCPKIN